MLLEFYDDVNDSWAEVIVMWFHVTRPFLSSCQKNSFACYIERQDNARTIEGLQKLSVLTVLIVQETLEKCRSFQINTQRKNQNKISIRLIRAFSWFSLPCFYLFCLNQVLLVSACMNHQDKWKGERRMSSTESVHIVRWKNKFWISPFQANLSLEYINHKINTFLVY